MTNRTTCVRQGLLLLSGILLVNSALPGADTGLLLRPERVDRNPLNVAREIDRMIEQELDKRGVVPAPLTRDEDFLRRATFDLTGTVPAANQLILFGLSRDPEKRSEWIEAQLQSPEYAVNWARYWRDVIYSKATNQRARLSRTTFEEWMTDHIDRGTGWNEIARQMITATGDVTENGATALIFAQEGKPDDVAAEVSRVFLGIQIQCANCHDHPFDQWKREQFHELAAYFPRIGVRPRQSETGPRSFEIVSVNRDNRGRNPLQANPQFVLRRFDRNRDGRLDKSELAATPFARAVDRLLKVGDRNEDGALSLAEIRELPEPPANRPGQGAAEYYMPDLENPEQRGTLIEPALFVTGGSLTRGTSDSERREALADGLQSTSNPWLARAYVNRIWTELTGSAFYSPVDDIGPEREPDLPLVLDTLSAGFVRSGYDMRWLFRVIMNTQAYQRSLQNTESSGSQAFAAGQPVRLRADQLYSALASVLGIDEAMGRRGPGRPGGGGGRAGGSLRTVFTTVFGFDPSTPADDVTGNIPQALFLMNSPLINARLQSRGPTPLAAILREFPDDNQAVREVYLRVLQREPSQRELRICLSYVDRVNNRGEAFEDLMWSLINSSEFVSRR